MEKRGICEEIIEKMKREKIDAAVLAMMDDSSLKEFVPLLGDRIALRNFCTENTRLECSKATSSKRETLLQKLSVKLGMRQSGASDENPCSSDRSERMKGNQNAVKENRKIDFGWIDFSYVSNSYKQVRKNTGGGTRQLTAPKSMGYADLLGLAKGLFFKDGISSRGKECDFEHDLCDFRQQPLEESVTAGQLYSETKMSTLRFYLRTKGKHNPKKEDKKKRKRKLISPISDSSEEDLEDVYFSDPLALEVPGNEVEIQECSSPEPQGEVNEYLAIEQLPKDEPALHCSSVDVPLENLPLEPDQPDTPTVSFGPRSSPEHQNQLNDTIPCCSTSHDQGSSHSNSQSQASQVPIIRRAAVVEDMITAFSSPDIMECKVSVHMVLPNGDFEAGQGSGVYRDALTQFWDEFFAKCAVGDIQKVPIIRHDYRETEWQAIGRILAKGWLDQRYFPTSLSPVFAETALYGSKPSDQDARSAFLAFLPEVERNVLSCALEEFPVDSEELLEILGDYDCRTLVNKDNLSRVVSEMGFQELFQKPKCIADFMQPVLEPLRQALTKTDFLNLYEELKPTSRKVLSKLQFPPECNAAETTVATFLKRYVRSLDGRMLKRFLRFCTGSDVLSANAITVMFTQMDGFERRPVGHTCGCVLQVPVTYESFVDLRQEFNAVLESGVWVMDVI